MSFTETVPLYALIASTLQALRACEKGIGHADWIDRHKATLRDLDDRLPSGAGFDAGTSLNLDSSTPECLRFNTSFHHMNDNGMYSGWSEHVVTVRPSLAHGITLTVSGRDRNGIKDYVSEVFDEALMRRALREGV